MKTVGAATI